MTRLPIAPMGRSSARFFSTTHLLKQKERTLVREGSKVLNSQSPNRNTTWSLSQAVRQTQMVGPRFEQTDLEAQPFPPSAIELIKEIPITLTEKRIIACDGGEGPLGHPKVYINLDKGEPIPCGYCGLRFQLKHH